MVYAQLGRSDLQISRIGFGCMSLKNNGKEQEQLIREAIEMGMNYFDTADLYEKGINEMLLGKAIRGQREKLVIATKVGNQWKQDGSGWQWNPSRAYILQSVEGSLKRLGVDCLDLYQLHGGTMEDPFEETLEAFEQLVQQGKIRYYGISSIRPTVIRRWAEQSRMVSVMIQYSLLDRRPEESIMDYLKDKKIGVLARGSVAQGLLIDKPEREYLDHSAEEVRTARKAVEALSGQKHSTQVALAYVLRHPALTSAVVGIRTKAHLREAIKALDTHLSASEYKELQLAVPARYYGEHR